MAWPKLISNNVEAVAPSGNFDKTLLDSSKKEFQERFGLNLIFPEDILLENYPFCSNTDEYRFEHLKKALYNPDTQVIWGLRGGYGCARLIESLEKLPKPEHEKIFVGYSDMTVLHLFFNQKWGWKTIHGAGVVEALKESKNQLNLYQVYELIYKQPQTFKIPSLKQLNKIDAINIKAPLTGGNLCMLETGIKASWEIDAHGKILLIEDTGEPGYKVDRMLVHLTQANIFKGVKAVVFGEFTDPKNGNELIHYALKRFADSVDFPVFKTDAFGHGFNNAPFVYGAEGSFISSSQDEVELVYSL